MTPSELAPFEKLGNGQVRELTFAFDDGGRADAGFKGSAGDCVTRAIAIATGVPYLTVYNDLHAALDDYAASHRDKTARRIARGNGRRGTTPRNGVKSKVYRPYLESLGWTWTPTMRIGSGCRVHLVASELPAGRLIARVSKHLVAIVDGVLRDTHDPRRGETVWYKPGCTDSRNAIVSHVQPDRCVYGYFSEAR